MTASASLIIRGELVIETTNGLLSLVELAGVAEQAKGFGIPEDAQIQALQLNPSYRSAGTPGCAELRISWVVNR